MGEVAVRSPPDELPARHDEYPRVPVLSQRQNGPVPQRLDEQERRQRQRPPQRRLRPAQKTLHERRDQPQSMDGYYHRIVTTLPLDRATSPKPTLVPPRESEFQKSLNPNEHLAHDQHHYVVRTSRPTIKG